MLLHSTYQNRYRQKECCVSSKYIFIHNVQVTVIFGVCPFSAVCGRMAYDLYTTNFDLLTLTNQITAYLHRERVYVSEYYHEYLIKKMIDSWSIL